MLTAAVRDLHKAHHDKYDIGVNTSCRDLWANNPYINRNVTRANADVIVECKYPLIHRSNQAPYHFIHGYRKDLEEKLGIPIPATLFKGDIHLSKEEMDAPSPIDGPFWIMMAGGKYDFTTKWWNSEYYQAVVDHFKGKITFVQCGQGHHWHPKLNNVVNMVGKTNLRQFVQLVYNSVGVVCPITFAMHAAVAVPIRDQSIKSRPCVVIAGGREPTQWEAYPNHRYLSMTGALPCCLAGGCWKSRCHKVGDKDQKDTTNACEYPVDAANGVVIPKCMDMIKPSDVIRAIESYYDGGVLKYGSN